MNLNNKGFAISGILYPLFILFLVLILGVIGTLSASKAVLDSNKSDVEKKLNMGRIDYVDVLIVGGGGSGASTMDEQKGGGGGAGGLVFMPNYQVPVYSTVSIYVGAGGSAIPDSQETGNPSSPGENGENSFFGSLVAIGGGGGRRSNAEATFAGVGGSGGGGHLNTPGGEALQRISMTGGFGNPGGSNDGDAGAGGGGAGTTGMGDLTSTKDGRIQLGAYAGGQGLYEVLVEGNVYNFNDMFGTTNMGHFIEDEVWFSGGGGGGIDASGHESYGAGGYGGGGRGAYTSEGTSTSDWEIGSPKGEDAMPNTGGGGGGSRGGESGAGGSGVVIVRYKGDPKAIGGEVYTNGGYTIHVFSEIGGHIFRLI